MQRHLLIVTALALVACHDPRAPLRAAKKAMREQTLTLERPSMNRVFATYARAEVLARLPGLPLQPLATRDANLPLKDLCTDRSSAEDEIDLSTAPQSMGCRFSGHLSLTHACAQKDTLLTWTWHYQKVHLSCPDFDATYDGDAALEIGEISGGSETMFIAFDLQSSEGALKAARYSYGSDGVTTSEILVLTDNGRSALIAWDRSGPDRVSRNLSCFTGRDALGDFTGSYDASGEVAVMSIFAPPTEKTPGRYRMQSPEGAVLPEGCVAGPPLATCRLPNTCE